MRSAPASLFLLIFLIGKISIFAVTPAEEAKMHALFLMQNNEVELALDRYQQYCRLAGRHDFETLQQMGLIMLQK